LQQNGAIFKTLTVHCIIRVTWCTDVESALILKITAKLDHGEP